MSYQSAVQEQTELPTTDLTSAEAIKHVYETKVLPLQDKDGWKKWLSNYVQIIKKVRGASPDELASPDFQYELWESTHISGTGMCSIPMTDAIQSEELAKWTASLRDWELPEPGPQRIAELKKIHDELVERTKPFTTRRPRLKIMRLLAASYPKDISCVVDYSKLRQLTKAMYPKLHRGQSDMVTMNALVYQRIDEVLVSPNNDAETIVRGGETATRVSYRIT